ncbi:MAG: D-alanyl-D-alanine carboxypeptidase [candidate division NC10 bacterium]|nr:D-alanyl-D-alanine carboxypeptidase [candidate division NC10 bacterium]
MKGGLKRLALACVILLAVESAVPRVLLLSEAVGRHGKTAGRRVDRPAGPAPITEYLDLPRPSPGLEPGWEASPGAPSDIGAASAILVDGNSGEVLFARNPNEPRPPASVTKILTALVILERGRLDDAVTVSAGAAGVGGYQLGLRRGQRASLQDLLAAILIMSANDAAVAAAEHVGGSVAGFAGMMNAIARRIGMTQSRFVNPHGLHEPGHYTTALDLALLTRVALDNPTFAGLVRSREATITVWKPGRRGLVPQARVVRSHNRLLGRVEGVDGVKTGYTDAAGRCLVASASRGAERMIAVLLNDPQRWSDATILLEFGFEAAAVRAEALPAPGPMPWREASRR